MEEILTAILDRIESIEARLSQEGPVMAIPKKGASITVHPDAETCWQITVKENGEKSYPDFQAVALFGRVVNGELYQPPVYKGKQPPSKVVLHVKCGDAIYTVRFSVENAFSMICLQLEQVNLKEPIYIKPERGTREKKSILARVFLRDGSPVRVEERLKLEQFKGVAESRWNALIGRIRQTHGTSAPEWNDSQEEEYNDDDSVDATIHSNEHYTRLFVRLNELGAPAEWIDYTKRLIAHRGFSPNSLTFEQAKQIFLFVKSSLNGQNVQPQ